MTDEPYDATGEPIVAPLSVQQIYHADDLAARMMGAVLLNTQAVLDVNAAAAQAVHLAYAVMNESRRYCLKDGKAVKKDG